MTHIFRVTCLGVVLLLGGCESTPTAPTTWSIERLREQLMLSNLNSPVFGAAGRLTRWRVPIQVNTNGLERVETALQHFEQWTSGAVRFARVSGTPVNGLLFMVGGAGGAEATSACGNTVSVPPPSDPNVSLVFQWDQTRAIVGTYIVRLGAEHCDDAVAGSYPSSVAEHQLAHALGVIDHFDGFQNRGGLDDPRLLAVVSNLYANPPGASAAELTLWGAR